MPSTVSDNKTPSREPTPPFIARLHANIIPLLLFLMALLIQLGGGNVGEWLRYDRDGILNGEVWRLISGHLVHLGWPHLWMNAIGLLLIWLLFGHLIKNSSWLLVILICALITSIGMLLFNPELQWYVGLSGILHGIFVAGAVVSIQAGYRAELLLLILLTGKLAWEQVAGPLPGSTEFAGGNVIVDAHLYGAVSGLIISFALLAITPNQKN